MSLGIKQGVSKKMDINTVLEAGLRASEAATHAADVVGAAVAQVGDGFDHVVSAMESDCCSSNNYPPTQPQ
jgi:hypothetical protein